MMEIGPVNSIDFDFTESNIITVFAGIDTIKFMPIEEAQQDFMELYEAALKVTGVLLPTHLLKLRGAVEKAQQSPLFKKGE